MIAHAFNCRKCNNVVKKRIVKNIDLCSDDNVKVDVSFNEKCGMRYYQTIKEVAKK